MTIMSGQDLVSAAKAGSLDRVSYHLKKRVPPDVRDEEGHTALYWAACRGHSAICRILLLHDADVNSVTLKSGATPLMACADNNHVACMEGLLRQKSIRIDQCSKRGDTALHMAVYRGYTSVVQLLIQYHPNPFIQNNFKRTALEEAQTQNEMDCVELLQRYMEWYRQHFPPRLKESHYSRESRKPTESQCTKKEESDTLVHKPHDNTRDIGAPFSYPSFQSSDSAVVLSSLNGFGPHHPSKTSSLARSCETPEDLLISLDCSLGYSESSMYDNRVDRHNSSSKIGSTSNCHSYGLLSSCVDPFSADSQYHSYTGTSNANNISLENGKTPMSESMDDNPTSSLFQITSASSHTKPLRSEQEKCEKYPSRVNDLSCKPSSDGVNDLLPSLKQTLNILPDGKPQVDSNYVNSNLNLPSETNVSAYRNMEVVSGVRMSEFIENLQVQLLQYQSALRKEQQLNSDLRQQIKTLKAENIKLKGSMHTLQKAFCLRSSTVTSTLNGVSPDCSIKH